MELIKYAEQKILKEDWSCFNVFQSPGQFRKFGTVIRRNGLEHQGEQTPIGRPKTLDLALMVSLKAGRGSGFSVPSM